jgi:hypothetical protein
MAIMSRIGFRNTLQWLECLKSVLRISSNNYSARNWFQEYATMVIMSRIGFRNRPQWLQWPKLILRICYNGYHVQNRVHK